MATSVSGLTTIDVNTIVSQLMTVERQPLTAMQNSLTGIQTKLSAFGRLQSQLAAFQDAAKALTRTQTWGATTATSGDETAVRATSSGSAQPGSHVLVVDALAQRQAVASQGWSGADAVLGGGTMRIRFGSQDPVSGAFSADTARPEVEITIPAGATLQQVRDAINAADAGVRASLVADGTGMRLMIRGDETGAANAFSIAVDGDPELSALAFEPGAASATMSVTQSAADALFSIDGLALRSAGNKIENVVEGLTLELRRAGPDPVALEVASDGTSIRAAIDKFVSAWNSLNSLAAQLTRYDATTSTAGTLQGNSTAVSMQRQLREILTGTVEGSEPGRLADAGITLQRDGSLAVDATRLGAALATPAKLQTLFGATGTTGGTDAQRGLARRFDTLITSMLGVDGALTGATETLRNQQTRVTRQQEAFETRMTLVEARLRRQYTALDAGLAQWGSLSSFLASNLNKDS